MTFRARARSKQLSQRRNMWEKARQTTQNKKEPELVSDVRSPLDILFGLETRADMVQRLRVAINHAKHSVGRAPPAHRRPA